MPADASHRSIVVGLKAYELRRHVGPTSWVVLEEMMQRSTGDRDARNLYVAMTRGRTTNHALVVTDTPELAEAISILEAALAIDRADIPATTHRRSLAAGAPSRHPCVPVPAWFEALRSEAQAARHAAQQELDERNTRHAERAARVAAAERDLPAAETAHAPHRTAVAAAKRKRYQARQEVWRAQADLRGAGRLHRRSARRTLDAATTHLATEERLLEEVDALAEPTRTRVHHLCDIISRARERDATESILDQWDELDGAAISANDLGLGIDL